MKDKSILEVDLLEAHNSTMVHGDGICDVGDDVPGVTLDEPLGDVVGEANDVEVENSYHSESEEEDET